MKTLLPFLLIPSLAFATGNPPKPSDPLVTSTSSAKAGAVSSSNSSAASAAMAKGGNASADQDQSQSADNSQSLVQQYQEVHQVPTMFQGALLVPDCGAGVNAGAGDTRSAGFFGFVWTTAACYAFKSGSNFAAIGDYRTACDLWLDINRKAFKRIGRKPDCQAVAERLYAQALSQKLPEPVASSAPPVDMSRYVTRDELADRDRKTAETIRRAFEASQRK